MQCPRYVLCKVLFILNGIEVTPAPDRFYDLRGGYWFDFGWRGHGQV